MLKVSLAFHGGFKRIDLHRLAALNYRSTNPRVFEGVRRFDRDSVVVHHTRGFRNSQVLIITTITNINFITNYICIIIVTTTTNITSPIIMVIRISIITITIVIIIIISIT